MLYDTIAELVLEMTLTGNIFSHFPRRHIKKEVSRLVLKTDSKLTFPVSATFSQCSPDLPNEEKCENTKAFLKQYEKKKIAKQTKHDSKHQSV